MDKKTAGVIIIICLSVLGVTALYYDIDGLVLTGIVGVITTIAGTILGISINVFKNKDN